MPLTLPETRNPASFRDPSGFVFEYQGRIFRAVRQPCLDLVRDLHDSGLLAELTEASLIVPTGIVQTPELIEHLQAIHPGFPGFLEHERIDAISYPYEWSPTMLADAGIATLDLQIRLLEQGYSLKDATAYNIQFVNGRPVFIDIPSIERPPRLDVWIALGQFGRMFTLPLVLHRQKGHSLRAYFLAILDGSDLNDVRRAFGRLELLKPGLLLDVTLPYLMGRISNRSNTAAPRRIEPKATSPVGQILNLKRLRAKLAKLAGPTKTPSTWSDYTRSCSYSDAAERAKVGVIRRFLAETRPATVLDVGCNTGSYAQLAVEAGARVTAADNDLACVDILYRRIRREQTPILPLCIDLANPSPAIGFCNRERPSFFDRTSADCVFALALIHHLHVSANLPLASIRDMFADLTERFLVLEFVPTDDVMFRKLMQFRVDLYQAFTLDHCLGTFGERFDLIRRHPVDDSPRTLLFWEKKNPPPPH